jgi:hypothetical protein
LYSFLGGTPGALLMFVHPGVKIKSIECDPGGAHRNLDEIGPDVAFKDCRTHAEIRRRLGRPE